MRPFLLVALGSAVGGMARYGVALLLPRVPWPTLVVNVLGCAILAALAEAGLRGLPAEWRLLLGTGFCGGFTTYSTFNLELALLYQRRPLSAALYLCGTALACILGQVLGAGAARLALLPIKGR